MQEVKDTNTKTKRRLIPDPNARYLYVLNTCWRKQGERSVDPKRMVENVRIVQGHFVFNFVGEPKTQVYECYYAWAFVLATTSNLEKYHAADKVAEEIKQLDIKLAELRSKVSTLEVEE